MRLHLRVASLRHARGLGVRNRPGEILDMAFNQSRALSRTFLSWVASLAAHAGKGAAADVAVFFVPLLLDAANVITPERQPFQRGMLR